MIIVCPSCASEYTLDPERIGSSGRKVRCAACRESWSIVRPGDETRSDGDAASYPEPDIVAPPLAPAEPVPQPLVIEPSRAPRVRAPARANARTRRGRPGRVSARTAFGRMGRAAAVLLLLAALPASLAFRSGIVAALPGTAMLFSLVGLPVNLAGLSLRGVASTLAKEGDAPVLVVTGEVVNVAGRTRSVPPIEITVEAEGGEVLYTWTVQAAEAELAAEAAAPFRARLASPPAASRRILVTLRDNGRSKVALR